MKFHVADRVGVPARIEMVRGTHPAQPPMTAVSEPQQRVVQDYAMAISPNFPEMSLDDFLAWESAQSSKHEYTHGVVLAMAGASRAHGTISVNIASIVRPALRGTACRLYLADMKVVASRAPSVRYPDAVVTCDERDMRDANVTRYPRLIVEVLSRSTASEDRGAKFAEYRTIPTLQEYVLVDSESVAVDVYRRASRTWTIDTYGPGDQIPFDSIGLRIGIEALYEDLDLGPVQRIVFDTSEDSL